MRVDWFTVVAQLINFVVLVWLLKRFLYKPVLSAIDERERKIAAQLEQAAKTREQADARAELLASERRALAEGQSKLMDEARARAGAEEKRLIEQAQQALEKRLREEERRAREDAAAVSERVALRSAEELLALVRAALGALADVELGEQVISTFLRRLAALDAPARVALTAALQADGASATVRTASALSPAQAARLARGVEQLAGRALELQFEVAPELIAGVELTCHGQRVSWSLSTYVDALLRRVREQLTAPTPANESGHVAL